MASGRRLFSQTDFRGALHRAPKAGQLELMWLRGDELQQASLSLAPGWRETVILWRASASGGNFGGHPSFWPLKAKGGAKPWFGKQPSGAAWDAGLRANDVITAVNGEAVGQRSGREFMTWFRLKFEGGDPVTLTVRRGGQERTVRYRAQGPGH